MKFPSRVSPLSLVYLARFDHSRLCRGRARLAPRRFQPTRSLPHGTCGGAAWRQSFFVLGFLVQQPYLFACCFQMRGNLLPAAESVAAGVRFNLGSV